MSDQDFKPKIVGFLCNWCSYAGADLAGSSKLEVKPFLSVIRVMCSSRVNSNMVLTSLLWGADGVLALGGKIFVCELALDAKDLKKEDFREGVEIIGATTFINDIKDATITFSF